MSMTDFKTKAIGFFMNVVRGDFSARNYLIFGFLLPSIATQILVVGLFVLPLSIMAGKHGNMAVAQIALFFPPVGIQVLSNSMLMLITALSEGTNFIQTYGPYVLKYGQFGVVFVAAVGLWNWCTKNFNGPTRTLRKVGCVGAAVISSYAITLVLGSLSYGLTYWMLLYR